MPSPNPKTALVTGSAGFIGRNLVTALKRQGIDVVTQTSSDAIDDLAQKVAKADFIYHLAGANRPDNETDFQTVNTDLTGKLAELLRDRTQPARLVFSSSIQATRDNVYGASKKGGEDKLIELANASDHQIAIYRLPNVFGKWSRPFYNTVVATFCHQIARDEPISISDPSHSLHLVYIDEVVRCFLRHLDPDFVPNDLFVDVEETHHITLGELAETLQSFRDSRTSLQTPAVGDPLTKYLYTTYLSFLPEDDFSYAVPLRTDDRGWLFELAKSDSFGQIFVSTTKPGITRGNHYHDTKVEKFCLVKGSGLIRFRDIDSEKIIEYPVSDQNVHIVDIPPGYTHSIENVGQDEMIVLFWANEVFNPEKPDTYWVPVIEE